MAAAIQVQSYSNAYDSFIDTHLKTYGYFSKSQTQLDNERESWREYEYDFAALWGSTSTCLVRCKNRAIFNRAESEGVTDSYPELTNYKLRNANFFLQKMAADMLSSQSSPRWPVEMQVVNEKIQHNNYSPLTPEPLSLNALDHVVPPYRPRLEGKVMFSYPVICGKKFTKSYNGNRISYPSDTRQKGSTFSLMFESRFESGNLAKAIQITQSHYELYLRPDLYSDGHTQWFYFKVQNMKKGINYRFSIVNLHKIAGLYDYGMKPVMYSERLAETLSMGWHRIGENITYSKNEYDPITGEKPTSLHTLSWTFQFPFDNDVVYFAHSFPYTYTDLQNYLLDLINNPSRSQWCNVDTLCRTLAGNHVYVVTVVSPIEVAQKKRAIVLTARVHPGETPSSWVMKGLIDFLTGDTATAQILREKFIFKLVPMLNPDGVIVGNNRYSLSGRDLNRTYKTLLKDLFPPTWHLRRMIRRLLEEYEVSLYCDLHGHSRKPNMFMYGCENRIDSPNYLREQVLPLVLAQKAPDMFSFGQCKFHMHKQREGTGRVVMRLMGVTNSYTLEVSFAGSTLRDRKGTHFSTADYIKMANQLCRAIADYFDDSKSQFFENQLAWRRSILQQLVENGSSASEPVTPKGVITQRDSDSSQESILSVDQIDDSIVNTKSEAEKFDLDGCCQTDLSDLSTTRKKKKKKRQFSARSLGLVHAKPVKLSPQSLVTSSTTVRNTVPKQISVENNATATWKRYQKLFEPQNKTKINSTYTMISVPSPRRSRIRSLLNLQRSIISQALLLRESSPLHKKLTKGIIKETLAMSDSLSKELQLLNEADKKVAMKELAEKNKAKAKKPSTLRPFTPKSKPKAVIPFRLSVRSTTPRLCYKGIMVP